VAPGSREKPHRKRIPGTKKKGVKKEGDLRGMHPSSYLTFRGETGENPSLARGPKKKRRKWDLINNGGGGINIGKTKTQSTRRGGARRYQLRYKRGAKKKHSAISPSWGCFKMHGHRMGGSKKRLGPEGGRGGGWAPRRRMDLPWGSAKTQ